MDIKLIFLFKMLIDAHEYIVVVVFDAVTQKPIETINWNEC